MRKYTHIQKHNSFILLFILFSSPDEAPNPTNSAFSNCNFNHSSFRKVVYEGSFGRLSGVISVPRWRTSMLPNIAGFNTAALTVLYHLSISLKKKPKKYSSHRRAWSFFVCPFCWKQSLPFLFGGKSYFTVHFKTWMTSCKLINLCIYCLNLYCSELHSLHCVDSKETAVCSRHDLHIHDNCFGYMRDPLPTCSQYI